MYRALLVTIIGVVGTGLCAQTADVRPGNGNALAGTGRLTMPGDLASAMIDGIDRFLRGQIDQVRVRRLERWQRELSSPGKGAFISASRERLSTILGLRDHLVDHVELELLATEKQSALIDRTSHFEVLSVRWAAFGDVYGEGLLLVPRNGRIVANIVALPDCEQTPEQLVGLSSRSPPESQFARRLAESGCRVLVPGLVNRQSKPYRSVRISNREFVYRAAYELGRHLIGYEVAKVRSGITALLDKEPSLPVGIIGYGEGGMLALYTAALEPRITAAAVCGYFESRDHLWQEPLDRNVFGLLERFGDAELVAMTAAKSIIIEAARGPEFVIPPGTGGGPGRIATPTMESVRREVDRARQYTQQLAVAPLIQLVESGDGTSPFGSAAAVKAFLQALDATASLAANGPSPADRRTAPDLNARQTRQFYELNRHNQQVLSQAAKEREQFWSRVNF